MVGITSQQRLERLKTLFPVLWDVENRICAEALTQVKVQTTESTEVTLDKSLDALLSGAACDTVDSDVIASVTSRLFLQRIRTSRITPAQPVSSSVITYN